MYNIEKPTNRIKLRKKAPSTVHSDIIEFPGKFLSAAQGFPHKQDIAYSTEFDPTETAAGIFFCFPQDRHHV